MNSVTIIFVIVNKTHSNPCRAYATYVGSTSCPRPSHVEVEGRCLSLCAGSLSRRMLYMHKLSHLSARATLEFHSHTCRWCRRGGGCSPWSTAARTSARQRCSSPYAPRTKPPPHLLRSRHCTAASIGSHPHRRRRLSSWTARAVAGCCVWSRAHAECVRQPQCRAVRLRMRVCNFFKI